MGGKRLRAERWRFILEHREGGPSEAPPLPPAGQGNQDADREIHILTACYLANRQEDATFAQTTLAIIAAVITYVLLVSSYVADHESVDPPILLALPAVPVTIAGFEIVLGVVAGMRRHEGEEIEKRLQALVRQDKSSPLLPGHLQSNRYVWDLGKGGVAFRAILCGMWVAGYMFVVFFSIQMLWLAGQRGHGWWWWGSGSAAIVYLVFFVFSMVALFRPVDWMPRAP